MPRVDNEQFYTSAVKKHGTTPKGVNWISSFTQEIRFKTILEMLPNDLRNYTIIDAGCGFGDFYKFLDNQNKLPKKYIGIDVLQMMCEITSKNTGCDTIQVDILKENIPDAQYLVCSGAMNILKRFETYQFIRNCYISSKNGFIFNILHGDKKSDTYNYMTTKELKHIAKDLGVIHMKVKTGYLKSDITVGLFKNRHDN